MGFESHAFVPLGRNKQRRQPEFWWVNDLPPLFFSSYQYLAHGPYLHPDLPVLVIKALVSVSPLGTYGHLGGYPRAVIIHRVYSSRIVDKSSNECVFKFYLDIPIR
jgi:hypothetical protein